MVDKNESKKTKDLKEKNSKEINYSKNNHSDESSTVNHTSHKTGKYKKSYNKSYKKPYKKNFHKNNKFNNHNKFQKGGKFIKKQSNVKPLTKNTALVQFMNLKQREDGKLIYDLSYPFSPKVYAYFVPLSSRTKTGIGRIVEIDNQFGKQIPAVIVGEINVRGALMKHKKLENVTDKDIAHYFKKRFPAAKYFSKKADEALKEIIKKGVEEPSVPKAK